MADGSLQLNLADLESSLSGVGTLLGAPGAGGSTGSGYAGGAGLVATSPEAQVEDVAVTFESQVAGLFEFDGAASVTGVADALEGLQEFAGGAPFNALSDFSGRLAEVGEVFEGGIVDRLQDALTALRDIADGVPEDGRVIAGVLIDQIMRILVRLEGPEAARIRAWAQSIEEMATTLAPLIDAAEDHPDPAALVLEVFRRALESTLEVLGAGEVQRFLRLLDDFPGGELNAAAVEAASIALDGVGDAFDDVQQVIEGEYPAFRDTAVAAATALEDFRVEMRPVLGALRRVLRAPIFQPGALEGFLREQMERALAVKVNDVQRIDDPFNALFDGLDEAIDGIDLSVVRTEVLGFFEGFRDTLEDLDIGSLVGGLELQLDQVTGVIGELDAGVSGLTGDIEVFFDQRLGDFRDAAGAVGAFQPDGTFRYHISDDLERLLSSARAAIVGDPADPEAPSVAGTITGFRGSLDALLGELNAVLGGIEGEIEGATSAAVGGIEEFTTYVEGLDLQALVEQLRDEIAAILEALGPIDFAAVIDPVVAELNANAEKLGEIDPEALNELLREALATALDIVIQIDFTAEISTPLLDEFAAVKALPGQALAELQSRYEEALSLLDELSPTQLLSALSAAFQVIENAVAALNIDVVFEPLDALHTRYLVQPLEGLRPSHLLQPVADGYDGLLAAFDSINGAGIIEPVDAQLRTFKGRVRDFDPARWVVELNAPLEAVTSRVRGIRPSEFLEPLAVEFERLESELDRFRPSVLLAPAADLAAPLLALLEEVQEETVEALFEMFQAPLGLLDRLQPEALTAELEGQIDALIAMLESLRLPQRFNQLKGRHYDLKMGVEAGGIEARIALIAVIDPQPQLGEFIEVHDEMLEALRGLRSNLRLPDLEPLYDELRQRLIAMLPPYARELLDPEAFRRLMRLADPTRFLEELDTRYQAIVDRLIPVRPRDLADELDATYDAVLDLVEQIDVTASVAGIGTALDGVRSAVDGIRVDFIAADIDRLFADLRSVAEALDIRSVLTDLDALHDDVRAVVASTRPSEMLAELRTTVEQVQAIVAALNPAVVLGEPLTEAWEAIEGTLGGVDFTVLLQPLVDSLDDLETEFVAALRETEDAFDGMLRSARGALRSGGAAASVSI